MSTITKERIEQFANDPMMCVSDEVRELARITLALLDELGAAQSENERLAKMLTERNGEPVEELVKRVAELEEIATDYGMKFQRAQDALKHQSLLHKTQIEAAEKRIADYQARLDRIERRCDHHGSVYWDVSNVKRCAKCGMAIIESANGATS